MITKQTISKNGKSVCPTCAHTGLCQHEHNQPCTACSRYLHWANAQSVDQWGPVHPNIADHPTCPMRHPDNGNCLPCGGFCTAVNTEICSSLHKAYMDGVQYGQSHKPAEDMAYGKWTPTTTRLPKEERKNYITEMKADGYLDVDLYPCLVVKTARDNPAKRTIKKAWFNGHGFIDADCTPITRTVTHWTPLPEMPPLENNFTEED